MTTANWNYPTSVKFGPGRIKELAQFCADAGIRAPLFVTDPGLAGMPMTQGGCAVAEGGEFPPACSPM